MRTEQSRAPWPPGSSPSRRPGRAARPATGAPEPIFYICSILKRFSKHSPVLVLAFAVALQGGSCSPYVYQAEFSKRPDTARDGDVLGPFAGRVLKAGTEKPVAGALVYASWELVRGVGFVVPGGAQTWVGKTDEDGRYEIPALEHLPGGVTRAVARVRIVIYKRGFVAYRSDRIFPGDLRRHDFHQLDNLARLEPWSPELSHAEHLRFVGGDGALAKASAWEVQAAVAQIEGRAAKRPRKEEPAKDADKLDVSELLEVEDLEEITGFEGPFQESRLKDVPRTRTYDSHHFRAQGKSQLHDAAYRVWKLEPRAADKHYRKLLGAYPNPKPTDELGDRSFRSSNKAIVALVWLVRARGVVVSLTCGRKLCKSEKTMMKLANTLHDRLSLLDQTPARRRPMLGPGVNPFRPVQPRVPVLR